MPCHLPLKGKAFVYSSNSSLSGSLGINIVVANCVRPRATNSRPYKFYPTVFIKFKFF